VRRCLLAIVFSALATASLSSQEKSDLLKYTITAAPGNIHINRMPGPIPPRSYSETFTFVVANTYRTDYGGSAPTCQTFDVEIVSIDSPNQPLWKWSKGKKFCQLVTPVVIPAGKDWKKTVIWKFTTAGVKDGKYRAIGYFVPTQNRTASVEFEITSVQ
jgi:hypothetical protein